MRRFKKMTIIKTIVAISLFTMPIGLSTFIISSGTKPTASGEPTYVESGLTRFIRKNNEGGQPSAQHIFPDATNAEINFKDIYNDVSYDETNKTITLGNIDGSVFEITDNYYFEHSDTASSSKTFDVSSNNPYHLAQFKEGDKNIYNWVNGKEQEFRQYTIKLISDVHLTNNSSIVMSSVLGGYNTGGIGSAGPVNADKYINIDLNGHTLTIDSDCTLYNYGHIYDSKFDENGKHSGMIDCKGTILTPFIVDDFDGGARQFAGTALALSTPFRLFSLPYLSCKVKFNNTAILRALSSLNASNELRTANMVFIGKGGFVELKEANSFLIKDSYNPYFGTKKLETQKDFAENYKTFYDFYGNINLNSISMSIKVGIDVHVDMAEFSFPIPSYAHINIRKGCNINLPLLLDFYPGSTLYTEEGSTINFSSIKYKSVIGLIGHDTKTSYGGIRVLNQLFPSSTNALLTAHPNYNVNNYLKYEREEHSLYNSSYVNDAINTKSRVEINSSITQSENNHILAGKINLGLNTINSLKNLNGSFKYINVDSFRYFYIEGSLDAIGDIMSGTINQSTVGSYLCLPLVSHGKVMFDVDSNNYSSLYESNYTYDFSDGVYQNLLTNKYKGFMFNNEDKNNLNGLIVEFSFYDKENHFIKYNGNDYRFFRNCFVLCDRILDENDTLINSYDNSIEKEIVIEGNKETFYKNFKQTRTRKMKQDWAGNRSIESDFPNRETQPIEELADTTKQENGEINIISKLLLSDILNNNNVYDHINALISKEGLRTSSTQKFTGVNGAPSKIEIGQAKVHCRYSGKNNEAFVYPNGETTYQSAYTESEVVLGPETGRWPNKKRTDTQVRTRNIENANVSYLDGEYSGLIKLFYNTKEGNKLLKYDSSLGTYIK